MKHILPIAALLTISTIIACTKDTDPTGAVPAPAAATAQTKELSAMVSSQARLSGAAYSQSISLDTANRMLESYLTSVGYPAVDTAIRSLSFDADTLRVYLENRDIVTLKFMVAHRSDYINSGRNGKPGGMKPDALTLIVVGLNDDQQTVLNNRGGVYDHLMPCPAQCPAGVGAPYIF